MSDPIFRNTSNLKSENELNGYDADGNNSLGNSTTVSDDVQCKRESILSNHTSFDGSDEEVSQYNDSNSMNFDDEDESLSDSQLNAGEGRHVSCARKLKKQKKRNRISQMISGVSHKSKSDLFQKLFKDMAGDEQLVSDYSCALQRDILVHGRLYLSQNWLCFYANIFGWETLVTIQWIEITAITKEKTAKLIPNAIQIFTETDKFFFSTFVTREHAYTALFRIWQNALLGQPMLPEELKNICKNCSQKKHSLREAVEGYPINDEHDETGDEMMEDDEDTKSFISTSGSFCNGNKLSNGIEETSESNGIGSNLNGAPDSDSGIPGNGNEVIEKEDDVCVKNNNSSELTSIPPNESVPLNQKETEKFGERKKPLERPPSPFSKAHDLLNPRRKKHKLKPKHKHQRANFQPFHLSIPDRDGDTTTDNESDGPAGEPDDDVLCPCHDSHKGKEYVNEEFNFDVDALYEHLFSQESDMMKRIFEERNFIDTKYTPIKRDPDGCFYQTLTYIIPLNYSIGPKQCTTRSKQVMQKGNTPGSFYVVKAENTSAGIPYADSFYISTHYCITRASGNRSKLRIHVDIIYVKKVFGMVKSMLSRGTDEAMKDHMNFLVNMLKSESDLVSFKEIKPKKPILHTKSNESSKSVHSEKPSRRISVNHHKFQTTSAAEKELNNVKISKPSLQGFAIMFCLLFFMNIYMMIRLRSLESSVIISKLDWFPKELPSSKEEWNKLLEYQKGLHELELFKLKEVIGNTANLLQQVQLSIRNLHGDIEKTIVERRLKLKQPNMVDETLMSNVGREASREDL